jgi:hypothetical protein
VGTSTPFSGGKNGNPLLPTWLNQGVQPDPLLPSTTVQTGAPETTPSETGDDQSDDEQPALGAFGSQFTGARGGFTRYAKSGGGDHRSLGRAIRAYVRKVGGGPRRAARRMASEKAAAGRIANILGGAGAAPGGIREILATLNLGDLASRTVQEIYAALVDYVCPPDGTLDDSYAREAYLEAVAELTGQDVDLERPTEGCAQEFVASFVSHAVRLRIINAIANGIVSMPADLSLAKALDAGLMDFIRGCTEDALVDVNGTFQLTAFQADVDGVFERVLEYIDAAADDVAEGRT